jgi:5-methylcytosine-specific restriction endonuclease McrA
MPAEPNAKQTSEMSYASPFGDIAYRALVYVRNDGNGVPVFYVAGMQGGPWKADNALNHSHKLHGGACFYCRKSIPKGEATVDHIEPQKLGGKSHIQNLALACKPCNAAKGHSVIDVFNPEAGKEWLEALLDQIQQRLNRL